MVYGDSDTQDGKLRAIQLGISRRVNEHFSLGLSFNYRWGKLKHLEYNYYSSYTTDYQVDLNGFNLQLGLVWNLNKNLTLALVIRPAYRMKVDGIREDRNSEGFVLDSVQFNTHLRYPLSLCLSGQVKISGNLNLYSDLSYWNWKQFSGGSNFSYDLAQLYDWPQNHDDLKFSTGLVYGWKPGSETKILQLAAGYVHDPYDGVYTNINDDITFGLALSLKKFGLEGSVKLPLAGIRDVYYINSSSYHLGLTFRL